MDKADQMKPAQSDAQNNPGATVGTMRRWGTGIMNPQNLPVLMLETNEGVLLNVVMPPEMAIELGQSLARDGETTKAVVPAQTN